MPATPLPDSVSKLLRLAVNWAQENFDPSEPEPFMPALLRQDSAGHIEAIAIPVLRPKDKPKLGRLFQQSIEAYQATAFVTEAWLSLPKDGKPLPEPPVILPPRCDPDRVEAAEIRLDVGGRTVIWYNEILRFVSTQSTGAGRCLCQTGKLKGWQLLADTLANIRIVPMNF